MKALILLIWKFRVWIDEGWWRIVLGESCRPYGWGRNIWPSVLLKVKHKHITHIEKVPASFESDLLPNSWIERSQMVRAIQSGGEQSETPRSFLLRLSSTLVESSVNSEKIYVLMSQTCFMFGWLDFLYVLSHISTSVQCVSCSSSFIYITSESSSPWFAWARKGKVRGSTKVMEFRLTICLECGLHTTSPFMAPPLGSVDIQAYQNDSVIKWA